MSNKGPIRLQIKVVPGSSRDCIAGWLGESLKVRVSAPPERGRANAAVIAVLAETLGVSEDDIRIAAGSTAARKVVEIHGLSLDNARQRLRKTAK